MTRNTTTSTTFRRPHRLRKKGLTGQVASSSDSSDNAAVVRPGAVSVRGITSSSSSSSQGRPQNNSDRQNVDNNAGGGEDEDEHDEYDHDEYDHNPNPGLVENNHNNSSNNRHQYHHQHHDIVTVAQRVEDAHVTRVSDVVTNHSHDSSRNHNTYIEDGDEHDIPRRHSSYLQQPSRPAAFAVAVKDNPIVDDVDVGDDDDDDDDASSLSSPTKKIGFKTVYYVSFVAAVLVAVAVAVGIGLGISSTSASDTFTATTTTTPPTPQQQPTGSSAPSSQPSIAPTTELEAGLDVLTEFLGFRPRTDIKVLNVGKLVH